MVRKEPILEVVKVWGRELIIVNSPEYCGKLLHVDKGARCSMHLHPVKRETFFCLNGSAVLCVEGHDYLLTPFTRPKTIEPGQKHSFWGITETIILEVSTHDDQEDVVRFSESQPGGR
mgnify:CR=1 FL=1